MMIHEFDHEVMKTPPYKFCMLEHVCYELFSSKKLQIWKIFYVNWLNFVYCLKFTSLEHYLSKQMKLQD